MSITTLADPDDMPDSESWSVDQDSLSAFIGSVAKGPSPDGWARLRRDLEELALLPTIDRLITLDMNRIDELPHQIQVAQQVLQPPMSGRAILADEVGLGKTIEAGIILKELSVRGLARRVLILTPASLVTQWVGEMSEKFFEEFTPIESPEQWRGSTRAIASYDRARQKKHAAKLLRHRWDLVIVDEAHKCKNHKTARYQFISEINRNYVLLLTATPIQNNLRELYNLINLLRPGHLGTWNEFKREYVVGGNTREARQVDGLRDLTSRVMVRTRRSSVAHLMSLPARRPAQPRITLTPPERALYMNTARLIRDLYKEGFRAASVSERQGDRRRKRARTGAGIYVLECLRLAQRMCSSSRALATSLAAQAKGEMILPEFRGRFEALAEQARAVTTNAKLEELTVLLKQSQDRIVVFSEHIPTVDMIVERVEELGRRAVRFTGSLSRLQRHDALKLFKREPGSVLVSTRAGTEGLNLQFCHQMVNYELPWNPMIVEQRIGRIHRFGQTREVEIHNYAAEDTVESHILRLLHTKIRLFELVVGELDLILGELGEGEAEGFGSLLGDMWLKAESEEAFGVKVDELGDRVTKAHEAAKAEEASANSIASEDSAGRLAREFNALPIPSRLRLGYGTVHLHLARGVEAARREHGLHVAEILEVLGSSPVVADAGAHRDYGPSYRVTGVTRAGREVVLIAQADRLPMTLIDLMTTRAEG